MTKYRNKTIDGIVVLLMLAASPLVMSDSHAYEEDKNGQKNVKSPNNVQKENHLRTILTENVVDGKLEVKHYPVSSDVSTKDMQKILESEGNITSWAYVKYKAYQEGIVLFDGKMSKIGKNSWITSDNTSYPVEKEPNPDLGIKYHNSDVIEDDIFLNEDLRYRIIFSGKMAETDKDIIFAISLNNELNLGVIQEVNHKTTNFIILEDSSGIDQNFRNSNMVIKSPFF